MKGILNNLGDLKEVMLIGNPLQSSLLQLAMLTVSEEIYQLKYSARYNSIVHHEMATI